MQVRKLSLQNFLARRRSTLQRLLLAERITTADQLRQWCDARSLEHPDDATLNSLFQPKVTPKHVVVPPRTSPVVVTPPPPPPPPPPSMVDTPVPAAVDAETDDSVKKSRPRKPRFEDEKNVDSE